MENIKLLYIDLFCGAGGTSTGVENARFNNEKCAKVIACVNHDANAIASHAANHPDALHFTEDIRTLELSPMLAHVEKMRAQYPDALTVLWASAECTNLSKAKGGMSRNPDSKTLAVHLYRYIEAINPDVIQVENVEEFLTNGPVQIRIEKTKEGYEYCPLDKVEIPETGDEAKLRKQQKRRKKKKYAYLPVYEPVKELKGIYYREWRDRIISYGYEYGYKILNAADYGAYTSRKRFFGVFAKRGLPAAWPKPTHAKNPKNTKDLFGFNEFDAFEKWKPVKDVLDFSDEGESIFTRKKTLSDKTLERIYAGLVKFVAGGKDSFLSSYYGITKNFNRTYGQTAKSTDEPCGVITTENRFAKVQAKFLSKYYSGHPGSKNKSIDEPAGTVTAIDHHATVSARFLGVYCGRKENQNSNAISIENPAPTITVWDRISVVNPKFIDQQFGNSKPSGLSKPLGCITTNPKYRLVSCFLMNPQYCSSGGSVDSPCFTLIARMDKKPPYLVSTETGQAAIEVYETDSEPARRIKEFMALYGIIDIKMRMLRIRELMRIMGFPRNYVLIGTQEQKKKYIGNAVEVTQARRNCGALVRALREKLNNKHVGLAIDANTLKTNPYK
jgi:DNA (cytosine-5)-methyltransferase 1